jgi:lipopolysaccharide transport system ATP-binding protein
MSNIAIKVENLAKSYQIGHEKSERYTALRDVLANSIKSFVGDIKKLAKGQPLIGSHEEIEDFWALDDVSFNIEKGDRVGIIGRNGAGKSTLLKILSRITEPTKGSISIQGRVASLLEVGTGFHPELTGRENVYLNGAILGMSRHEIKRKFDEIVAFAEVEKFLDTPVKRYSSGMYVRLAFAVAAHLEPEILIVDEVLAVGDAQFQKKCLGKMEDVSKNDGRTVLFVSHSMPTVTSLCNRGILMQNGRIAKMGTTSEVVMHYYSSGVASPTFISYKNNIKKPGDEFVQFIEGSIRVNGKISEPEIDIRQSFTIEMEFEIKDTANKLVINPFFYCVTSDGTIAFVNGITEADRITEKGIYKVACHIEGNFLNEGTYFINLGVNSFESGVQVHFYELNALSFNIKDPIDGVPTRYKNGYSGIVPGVIRPLLNWNIEKI